VLWPAKHTLMRRSFGNEVASIVPMRFDSDAVNGKKGHYVPRRICVKASLHGLK
jgi:hypothetical protein